MSNSKLYFVHCLTPVHIGSGQGVGLVDMPIMRERITEWPLLPGTSVKGVKREHFRQTKDKEMQWVNAAFGKAPGDQEGKDGNAGALVISDGRLLAFPVASRNGTFAYVTCPFAIKRMVRDVKAAGLSMENPIHDSLEKILSTSNHSIENQESNFVVGNRDISVLVRNGEIHLDEFESHVAEDQAFGEWAERISILLFKDELSRKMFRERLVLISDEAFQYFVTMCCEITTRIRISEKTKTVEDGALWTEEYLPAESVLYGIVWCDKIHTVGSQVTERELLKELSGEFILQIGGNATVGKGRIRCSFSEGTI
ncbi:type III-B CRISPR module RAMP protein Cmr4 [Paenibacillus pinihumi]|uniref:type III-B CRISPR module RAMP protein Cmr4 n=1 Tax=Paenibacillus pinihumi TaxID=669462 RepID=UPI00041B4E24|nr:type III-B CRISPR module RAMP protein Cmr4 [Paenibacillus pinihumi]